MKVTDPECDNYWTCIIGPVKRRHLPTGADIQPRMAAEDAIVNMTGVAGNTINCWSGWGNTEEDVEILHNAKYYHRQMEEMKNMSFIELVDWWRQHQKDGTEDESNVIH